MATINISDLNPAGLELFSESESYMNEISEGEFTGIQGGTSTNLCWAVSGYITGKAVDYVIAQSRGAGGYVELGPGRAVINRHP